ncbi:MAG: DUF488 family protein [Candidatus Rokubacteria bacterium]|nr:DUF488 family protein [Candidatus Rokubacteria bacterium]
MITTKRVSEPRESGDGTRVLVMRLWPRGVRKDHVDLWLKALGTDLGLIRAWKGGRLGWAELRRRYREGLKTPEARAALAELRGLARRGTVTLLCSCPQEARCHRGILKAVLTGKHSR